MTQEGLAKELFVSKSVVGRWGQGRGLPSLEVMKSISQYFNVSINELISADQTTVI